MRKISIAVLFLLFAAVFSPAYAAWISVPVPTPNEDMRDAYTVNKLYFVSQDTGYAVGNSASSLWKATNGGREWEPLPDPYPLSLPPARFLGVYFKNSQEGWVSGASATTGHTVDGGQTWELQLGPISGVTMHDIAQVGDELWLVGYDWDNNPDTGVLFRSRDNGATWTRTDFQTGGFFGIEVFGSNNVWLIGTDTALQTQDMGRTFKDHSASLVGAETSFRKLIFIDSRVGYIVGNSPDWTGKLYTTIDSGKTWSLRKFWDNKDMQALGMAIVGNMIYIAGGDAQPYIGSGGRNMDVGSIVASNDWGYNWVEVARGPENPVNETFNVSTTLYAGIFQLGDKMWAASEREVWYFVPDKPVFPTALDRWQAIVASRESHQIPLTESANQLSPVFRLLEAPKWAKIDTLTGVITGVPANSDIGSSKIIVQVTLSNGQTDTMTIELEVSPPVTAVEEEKVAGIPSCFDLSQNYPNPFNPETMIDYSLSAESDVRLSVFDLAGQEIIVLVSEKQLPGFYSVRFTAANLPSGSYIIRLTAGGAVQTRKMIIIK